VDGLVRREDDATGTAKTFADPSAEAWGFLRISVDRRWPRGLTKERAAMTLWLKDVALRTELRKWFGHDPAKRSQFQARYRKELREKRDALKRLKQEGKEHTVTLVYGARDEEHNGALGLKKIHKERMLDAVAERYPARHYVMADDKLRILAAIKRGWEDRVTTIFPRQGHYALDPNNLTAYPAADLTVERIGDLVTCDLPALLGATTAGRPQQEPR
jgi:uncharacterized protein YeaO (DUF488 family)